MSSAVVGGTRGSETKLTREHLEHLTDSELPLAPYAQRLLDHPDYEF